MNKKFLLISENNSLIQNIKTVIETFNKLSRRSEIICTDDYFKAKSLPAETKIDYIILDLTIKSFNPTDFIKDIRNNPITSKVKIISFSSNLTDELKKNVFYAGCDSVLSEKELPVILDNLLQF
jgi:CheY-like chemotaxis protein